MIAAAHSSLVPQFSMAGLRASTIDCRGGRRAGAATGGGDRHRWGVVSARAAKGATATIPIASRWAPIRSRSDVASLNRPGGNVTGVASLNVELGPKRLELLGQLVP